MDLQNLHRMPTLPGLNRVIDVLQGRWKAHGSFGPHCRWLMLAKHASNSDLTWNDSNSMRLAIARFIVGGGGKGFDAVLAHETVKRREHVVIVRAVE